MLDDPFIEIVKTALGDDVEIVKERKRVYSFGNQSKEVSQGGTTYRWGRWR